MACSVAVGRPGAVLWALQMQEASGPAPLALLGVCTLRLDAPEEAPGLARVLQVAAEARAARDAQARSAAMVEQLYSQVEDAQACSVFSWDEVFRISADWSSRLRIPAASQLHEC